MKNIDFEYLEEMYEMAPTKGTMRKSTEPVGSLTDNRRKVKPLRDGAHKRLSDWARYND